MSSMKIPPSSTQGCCAHKQKYKPLLHRHSMRNSMTPSSECASKQNYPSSKHVFHEETAHVRTRRLVLTYWKSKNRSKKKAQNAPANKTTRPAKKSSMKRPHTSAHADWCLPIGRARTAARKAARTKTASSKTSVHSYLTPAVAMAQNFVRG